jgi:hypothetical protein
MYLEALMNTFVILMDIALSVFLAYLAIVDFSTSDSLWSIAFIVLLILNIFCIKKPSKGSPNWFSLYLQRKALEEKKKINDLKSED